MIKRSAVAVTFLVSVVLALLLLGWQVSAGSGRSGKTVVSAADTAENSLILDAQPTVRRVDPQRGPGVFQVRINVALEAASRAFLAYELAGVPHWTATVRSINGLPAEGGFAAVPSSGIHLQMEEINPRWLRPGVNQIEFRPMGETVPYTVRNLRLVLVVEGAQPAGPRLRISHPTRGEQTAEGAYVAGFVDPATALGAPAELFLNGAHVAGAVRPAGGSFAAFAPRTGAPGQPWEVEVEVVYADGTRLAQTVRLPAFEEGGEGGDGEQTQGDAEPGKGNALALGKNRLEVDAGSVDAKLKLTMRRLAHDELPALDAGMTNVTPLKGGLRMGPHGTKFKKAVRLTIPYDPALLPQGMTQEDIQTFFFDEEAGRWVPVPRLRSDAGAQVLVSLTDHFTDFINATLALPDEPAGEGFSPNSLKELASADPAAEIVMIEPPQGGPMGDATLDLPLVVPPGRHGLEPALSVAYDSARANGWLGLGWDLKVPSVEVSTLFGVPRYDPGFETESYYLDGEQLAPLADETQARAANRTFTRRVEGSFQRIVRKGSTPADYWWEVTDQEGVRYLYGQTPQARLRDPHPPHNTFRWMLERVIDPHGNTVDYAYRAVTGGDGEPWVQLYPERIAYTGVRGQGAFYEVRFFLDGGGRPDRLSTGRPGFKVVTDRLLTGVDVLAGGELVRRYRFEYREGEFRKTLLAAVATLGEDGETEFYRHGFRYEGMPGADGVYDAFGEEEAWGRLAAFDAETDSLGGSGGGHVFVGLGPPGCQPHFGVQVGGNAGGTDTAVAFLDVNGDGLPDRLHKDGDVDLNLYVPENDQGGFEPGRFSGATTLESTVEWSFDFGGGGHAAGELVNLGASWVWSHSNDKATLADVNGDGRPDIVRTEGGFSTRINTGSSFASSSNWAAFRTDDLGLGNPREEAEVLAAFKRSDALRRLRLPYSGRVTVTGEVQKKQPGGDGVETSIFHDGARVWRRQVAADDTAACVPAPGDGCGGGITLDVQAGDDLYFLAGSGRETSADALLWAPRVTYEVSPEDLARVEPYGSPVFQFDAGEDFRLAGSFGGSWTAPAPGTVRILGPITKQATSDDVTVSIVRMGSGGTSVLWTRELGAGEETTADGFPEIAVEQGDTLDLRVTAATPFDPDRVAWQPTVAYTAGDFEPSAARVRYDVPKLLPQSKPTVSMASDGPGTLSVTWQGGEGTLLVQGVHRLLARLPLGGGVETFAVESTVPAGEPLFFTVLAEQSGTLAVNGQAAPFNLRRVAEPGGEVLAGGYHNWFYGEWDGGKPFSEGGLSAPGGPEDGRDFVPAIPSWQGGDLLASPQWRAGGFDLYIAAEGMKPSRQGGNPAAQLDQANGGPAGSGLSVLRKTSGRTAGVSASAGAGVSLSAGSTDTDLDLLDMNGDGYPDQVSGGGVRFSNGRDGFGPLFPFSGLSGAVREVLDANFAKSIGVGITHTRKDGQGRSKAVRSSMPSVGTVSAVAWKRTDLMDVNGDGLPDRVTRGGAPDVLDVQLNLGYRFGATERWPLPRLSGLGSGLCSEPASPIDVQAAAGAAGIDLPGSLELTVSAGLQVGFAYGPIGGGVSSTLSRQVVGLADVNGDGLLDHVAKDDGDAAFRVRLNLGDGWDAERLWRVPSWRTTPDGVFNPAGRTFQCVDALETTGNFSGDASAGAPICIPLVPPIVVAGLQIEPSVQASAGPGGTQISFQDLDGDGLPDHVLRTSGGVAVKRNKAARANLLTTVERPLGSTVHLAYRRQGNRVGTSDDGERRIDLPETQWVLAATTVDDGRGHAYTTAYEYFNDGFYDRAEREFYGYARVLTTLPDGSTVDRTFHNQDFYRRFLPKEEKTADAAGNLFLAESSEHEPRPVGPRAVFPARVRQETLFYEGTGEARKVTAETFQYDALGHLIAYRDFADEGSADDVAGSVAYHSDPEAWIFKPSRVEVRDGAGRLLRQRESEYDEHGDLIRLEQVLQGGRDPETGSAYAGQKNPVWRFTYDEVGNQVSSVDPTGFTNTVAYDPETRTYPVRVQDSFGYVTRFNHDLKHGKPAVTWDKNGHAIRQSYDGFGRLTRVVGPDDSDAQPTLAIDYGRDEAGQRLAWAVIHHRDVTRPDPMDKSVFIDSLARTVQEKEDADLDLGSGTGTRSGMRVSGRVEFDARGRVAAVGQPVFNDGPAGRFSDVPAKNPTRYVHDVLDRVREVRFPHGAVTRLDYGFGTLDGAERLARVRTDANGRVTRLFADVKGDVLGIEQANSYNGVRKTLVTRYGYDALSQLTSVTDPKGNATRLEHDTLGRNVVLDSPDLGRTELRYDPAGNLGAKITANLAARGQQIRYHHTFNRLDRIDYPETPDVVYTYGGPGAPENRADRLATVTDESGVEELAYNKLGQVIRRTRTVVALNGGSPKGPFTTSFRFDSFNRLLGVVYPDGEELTYGFDANGQVRSATGVLRGVRFEYLRHRGYDEFGDVARTFYGNGVETRYGYDPLSRRIDQILTVDSGGRELQDLRFQHDRTGTLLALQNDVPLPSPPQFGGPVAQTFRYDEIYQLIAAEGTLRGPPNKQSSYTLALAYDEAGSVVSKHQHHQTGTGRVRTEKKTSYDWTYTYGGAQPHAPVRIGDRSFRYDLNGNQVGWDSDRNGTRRALTWDEENRLKAVADNGRTTRFLYDSQGTRTHKAGQHGETIYVNSWFSVRNGAIASKHVWADDLRLSTKVSPAPEPSSEKLYFYQPGHLGSTHFVTDELGEAYQRLEYFASGEIWTDERSEAQRTPYLFSGKELDEETGLSYFGFRYLDARQGQWLSADPVLDGMLDTGKLETPDLSDGPFRQPGLLYAYAGNNPSNLTDPDGLMPGGAGAAPKGGVYVLKDRRGVVQRTGRATTLHARQLQHARNPELANLTFVVVYRTDNYDEQRGLEFMVYNKYPKAKYNKIRAIADKNPKKLRYISAANKYLRKFKKKK